MPGCGERSILEGETSGEMHVPDKVVPINNVLWDIVHRVGQVKAVLMAVDALVLTFLKLDKEAIVAETQLLRIFRYS